jgi:hypothetical protein
LAGPALAPNAGAIEPPTSSTVMAASIHANLRRARLLFDRTFSPAFGSSNGAV